MTVILINKTDKRVIIELNNNKFELNNNEIINISLETNNVQLNCFSDEISTFKYLPLSKSVIVEYDFVLASLYGLTLYNNCEITLVQKQIKGDNLELYKYVDLQLNNGCINNKAFYVQDEASAKEQLAVAREKEIKLEKRLKIIDALQTICYIGVPALIIFLGIWYFVDFKNAISVIIILGIVGIVIGLLLKKVISKFNNKIDKANARFDNVNQHVDTNSFFDRAYILSVLNDKN